MDVFDRRPKDWTKRWRLSDPPPPLVLSCDLSYEQSHTITTPTTDQIENSNGLSHTTPPQSRFTAQDPIPVTGYRDRECKVTETSGHTCWRRETSYRFSHAYQVPRDVRQQGDEARRRRTHTDRRGNQRHRRYHRTMARRPRRDGRSGQGG